MDWEEFLHITVSVLSISLAFSIIFPESFGDPIQKFFVIFLTVGLGFILHELAHKYVAMHYGAYAVYRAWVWGLVFAVSLAFATQFLFGKGFVFAAPGAVYIFGPHLSRKHNGLIGLAGPLMNLVVAIGFSLLGALSFLNPAIASLGFQVNMFLGFFNLLPFYPMDGEKVVRWNQNVWFALFIVFMFFVFFI
ncbi:site-2 protease family protein [Candidatus Micrarchaeota archaeon]|nr:site-2 protease family protein [Candidatus Micrarchaeota archaeon]